MSIDAELLSILACPACGGSLFQPDETSLVCETCGNIYPVQDGIPSLIIESAKKPNSKPEKQDIQE